MFFVNVPIGAVVLALAPRIVPESRSQRVSKGGYDVEGAVASTLGTIALVFTLIKADSWGWSSGRTLAGFAIAAVLIAAFIQIERRHRDPLVPLRIFSNRSLAAADATFLLVAAALFGVFFFCTLYLQQVLGYSALKTGVAYLPLSLTLIGASALASRLVDRFTPKPVLTVGLLIATGGFILLTLIDGHGDYASHVLPAMIVLGLGLGMSFVPITIAATNGVASGDSGLASGLPQHHPAGRRLAGPRGPLLGFDQPHDERPRGWLCTPGRPDARVQGRLYGRGGALRRRCGPGDHAVTGPPARARRRAGRGDDDLIHPLPRSAVLRPSRSRGRLRAPMRGALPRS